MIYTHPKEEFNIIICHYLLYGFFQLAYELCGQSSRFLSLVSVSVSD